MIWLYVPMVYISISVSGYYIMVLLFLVNIDIKVVCIYYDIIGLM